MPEYRNLLPEELAANSSFRRWTLFNDQHESIFMEISQKYTIKQIEEIARSAGFAPVRHFFDSRGWFVDSLWEAV